MINVENFIDGFMKQAEQEKDPSWFKRQMGAVRAKRHGENGINRLFSSKKYLADTFKGEGKGALKGTAIGGAAGGLAGLAKAKTGKGALAGAALGGLLGMGVGGAVGFHKADRKYLAEKGIKTTHLGFDHEFSPEAKKTYIDDYKHAR